MTTDAKLGEVAPLPAEALSGEVARLTAQLQRARALQTLPLEILRILSDSVPFDEALRRVLRAIKASTGFEAVGIRLRQGDDFPYLSEDGFSREFVAAENRLVARTPEGDICRDACGRACLECTCGLVLSGQTTADSPLFTPGGSCFVNRGRESEGAPSPQDDPRLNARDRCLHEGFHSVALIPVRAHQEIIGLLQLNDRRKDLLTLEMVQFLEGLTAGIGLAVMRQKTEDALRAREEQYRLLFTQMTEGFALHELVCDADGKPVDYRYLDANPAFERLTGLDVAGALGKTVRQLMPQVEASWIETYGKVALTGESIQYEGRSEDLGRDYRVVAFSPQRGQFATLFEDITERKQAAELRRKAQAMQRAMLSNIADVVAIIDASGINRFKSANVERLFGWPPEELIGKSAFENLHPDDREDAGRVFGALLAPPGGTGTGQCRYRCKDGSYKWIEYTATDLSEDPDIGGVLLNYHDISQRRQAEAELQQSHEMLTQLTAQVPGVVYQYVLHPDGSSCFPFSSPGMQAIYEVTPEEVQKDATPVFGMLHPEDYNDVAARIQESARTLELFHCEFRVVLPRQGLRWRLSDATPQRLPDGGTLWYGIISDVTERKLAEEALREKHAELERFTYAVSHDLKSPLVTVKTFLGYLEKDLLSRDEPAIARDLGFIGNAADKMTLLLDELVNLSRVGRIANPPVEVALQTVVAEALALVAGRISTRGVTVEVTREPVWLWGDSRRLVEVFQNLLDNAAKFMGEQTAPRIGIGVEPTRDGLILFVRDNGMGFEPQHHDRLFGLFDKLDSRAEGTGMGLTLVRRIIELHGGKISAFSDGPGRGATFRFTLARARRVADMENAQ